ncbi:YegS/Rv2252/BmrU family lipid kinase [Aequitasia blattaphilus]|uniref:Diacylglycerol kinase family lipid kinase n=1 Tax=Aequitasia blattaphilus TaxID=2949332 RepID=A0ABT1EE99_9FIRM|nr:diacylglycerol kinase family protein [Aequitasia blattaphilus]MCP1103262.1 diacylglycerol kinase family lipid kinase [Aequitasia blattaphilus]MCR8615902.1 diacylglycerol kinase family lipid kinase [Aequitasia blattaphilus]
MYHFIVNPNARSGLGKDTWNTIERVLVDKNVDYQVYETKYQRHATAISRKITEQEGIHNIIVLGGDGTVNEVVNGIFDLERVILGYVPIGSSNDFARGLSLSQNPLEALAGILNPKECVPINVGIIGYGNQKRRRFCVSSGLGFDAAVCHQIVVSHLKTFFNKIKLGKLAYAGVALQQLIKAKPSSMSITVDGKTTKYEKVLFAAAMNLKYEGGGFMFAPKAVVNDSILNIVIAHNLPKLKILLLLPLAYRGLHTHFKGISILEGKNIIINSEVPLPIHTDGEPIFLHNKIHVTLEGKTLRVVKR